MSLGNAKRTANKEKRRELREQLSPDKEVSKDRKLVKEEVNRRLVSGLQTINLEYDSLYNYEKASLNKDCELLSLLFHRMFFLQVK